MRRSDPIPRDLSHANGHVPDLSGEEVLDGLVALICRFVVLSYVQAVMVALWVMHTHAVDAADCTPYLSITSAEKRSGKTRLLEVLSLLVARPWLTGRVSAAVLVRKTANEQPSLLLDESDAAFRSDRDYAEALRGILNAGFRRGGVTSLCVGQGANLTYRDFPVFSPKAIAGIGKLPDTIADRAIPIELRRRHPNERVERFRQRKVEPEAVPLHSAAAAWAEAHLEALAKTEPELPDELDDRAQDIIEPLLAIADEAGGEWPERARKAAVELLTGEKREEAESLGVRLLRDIRAAFKAEGEPYRLATGKLLDRLLKQEDAPWRSLRGEPLSARGLALRLKPYGVVPKQFKESGEKARGYHRGEFEDAWARYLPAPPTKPGTPVPQRENPLVERDSAVPGSRAVPGSENNPVPSAPHKQAKVPGYRVERGDEGREGDSSSLPDDERPLSFDLKPGESATVAQLAARRDVERAGEEMRRAGSGPALALAEKEGDQGDPDRPVQEVLGHPPNWLTPQLEKCRQEPHRFLNPTSCAIATEVFGTASRWREVLPVLEAHIGEEA